jgi:DNA modification methylase
MRGMEAGSVDCVFTDLPYFEIVKADWDNQWKTRADYLDWIVSLAHEWKRITKDNSSIFLFCDEKMEAYIQVRLDEIFLLLNKIVWFKPNNLPQKNAHMLRTFAPMTERALFYATADPRADPTGLQAVMNDMATFKKIRDYFQDERNKTSLSYKEINELCFGTASNGGGMASNILTSYKDGWSFPTQEKYEALQKIGICPIPYEALRQEYEALRRPFNADTQTRDVIEWPIVGGGENTDHPTTKPLGLCRRIVSVITNPGQVVLDCCMGSGTAGVACVELGRPFIGCDNNPQYFAIAEKRIAEAQLQPPLFREETADKAEQVELF